MIPTDLHRSASSPHSAGRRQGDVDERYSAAVDRVDTRIGPWFGSVLRAERIPLDFHE